MAALSVDGTPMPALPNSADQINYDNTTSGLSATTVKGAVDELASEKQDKSDNSLQTTDKTIVGGINELKSGLIDVNNKLTTLIWEGNFPSTDGSSITVEALATSTLLVLVNSDGVAMLGTASFGGGSVLTYNATTITSYAYQYYITNDGKTLNVNVNAKGCYDSNGNAKAITKIYRLV
jgi:hypothetical protein